MGKNTKKTIRFTDTMIKAIEEKAKLKGIKFSEYIRYLVIKDIENK